MPGFAYVRFYVLTLVPAARIVLHHDMLGV